MIASFTNDSLVPYLEHTASQLNAHIERTRKGISRSLMNISKKFFGGNAKTASPAAAPRTVDAAAGLSPEACLRRVGDLSFMLQDYEAASSSYALAKREYNERAWLAIAGVQVPLTRLEI